MGRFSSRKLPLVLGLTALGLFVLPALGKKKHEAVGEMDAQKQIVHALNRLTFGPRPGDIERVSAMGLDKWIDLQLHPEKIDDSALAGRLEPFGTLRMTSWEMARMFPPGPVIRAVMDGKLSMPSDPTERAIYQLQIAKLEDKNERKEAKLQTAAANVTPGMTSKNDSDEADAKAPGAMMDPAEETRRGDAMFADAEAQQLMAMAPEQRLNAILKLSTADQRALITEVKGNQREKILDGVPPQQRELMMAMNNPQQVVNEELLQAKLLRAIYSERQLQEVMTDFWFNHFNVYIGKGADRYMLTDYERDVIRPHALGKFEDLLVATAQSPAMLFYLDNWLSVGPNSDVANGIRAHGDKKELKKREKQNGPVQQAKGKRNGLNENYGRELMELHTLGVNGGYTQKDVTEVAKVLTGWTLKQPREGGGFEFDERMHEPGDKVVLGHRIKPNGEKEGYEVLHILAHNPSTAKFICTKLAMRFVSDDPPPALVQSMAQTFLKKDGDIREVLKTMLKSPEFWAPDAYRAKVKTPLEFVASAARASGADISNAMPMVHQLQNMGMPLYGMQPPTGYSMKAETWVSSAALLGRMNFALSLASGKMRGAQVDPQSLLGPNPPTDGGQALADLESTLLAGDVSKQTHDTIAAQLGDPTITQSKLDDPKRSPNVGMIAGLLLGSPEFQRR